MGFLSASVVTARLLLLCGLLGWGASGVDAALPRIFIKEYKVKGVHQLTRLEIEQAVYPYLGPSRSPEDVEKARVALEQKYQAKGIQTVSVQIPDQAWQDGSIQLEVTEIPVGRLRVRGARYFLPERIKAQAPSLAEGKVLNFNDVNRDVQALNQQADARITPKLLPGTTPNTVDVELQVKDTLPLHGSLELNNRYSADTTPLRLNGAVSYDNLWQRGHSIGGNFQITPMDPSEVQVASGFYEARIPGLEWMTWRLQGTKQNSQVSTLGDIAVAGRGETIGVQGTMTLPGTPKIYNSLSFGFDYKSSQQNVTLATNLPPEVTQYRYFPFHATYTGVWVEKDHQTEWSIGPVFGIRGWGSGPAAFGRNNADSNFLYVRAKAAHTHELPLGFEVYADLQGQAASKPLVSGEQFAGGGRNTVRGYLEGQVLGDNALCGRAELRSPSLLGLLGKKGDGRLYLFVEGGRFLTLDPLPEQECRFDLASFGIGGKIELFNHFEASLDLGVPLIRQSTTHVGDLQLTFSVGAKL
jgi:hemolysin activation/secretion protein